jgi:hypothetical protein
VEYWIKIRTEITLGTKITLRNRICCAPYFFVFVSVIQSISVDYQPKLRFKRDHRRDRFLGLLLRCLWMPLIGCVQLQTEKNVTKLYEHFLYSPRIRWAYKQPTRRRTNCCLQKSQFSYMRCVSSYLNRPRRSRQVTQTAANNSLIVS